MTKFNLFCFSVLLLHSAPSTAENDSAYVAGGNNQKSAKVTLFTGKNAVQNELNNKWAMPLQKAYTAYRCGVRSESSSILSEMIADTSEAVKSSPITYGFLLAYSEHLGALDYQIEDVNSICSGLTNSAETSTLARNTTFDDNTYEQAIDFIIKSTGIEKSLGQSRVNNLMITARNMQMHLGVPLNASILMSACNLPKANEYMPKALDVINAAGLMGEPDKLKIEDALDVWFGYSQGSYWHALYLVKNSNSNNTKNICNNLDSLQNDKKTEQ